MIYFAIVSRTSDGLALTGNSDSPQLYRHQDLDDAYRKMKLLSRISARFPDRCTLLAEPYAIHFITALNLSLFVLCDVTYPQVLAFSFLSDMQRDFLGFYDKARIVAVQRPYALIEFDIMIQKLKQRYNNPRSLSTRVNLQDLSEELRLRPPYVLCEEELRPGYGQQKNKDPYRTTTASSYSQYLPLHLLGVLSLTLSCFCAVLNFSRGVHLINETHSHIDTTFDVDLSDWCHILCMFISVFVSGFPNILPTEETEIPGMCNPWKFMYMSALPLGT